MNWAELVDVIPEVTLEQFDFVAARRVGGGDINDAWVLQGKEQSYFVKLNDAALLDMFEAEFEALKAMLATDTIRVPQVYCTGILDDKAFVLMEYLELSGRGSPQQLGEQLAAMHRVTQSRFGWWRDNTIGATPQKNEENADWIAFYGQQRLAWQLKLLRDNGVSGSLQILGQTLIEKLPLFFTAYQPVPSMLHGDLWGGNYAFDETGTPVLFDPALYFGDREADMAMTELFGGFDSEFYAAYNEAWPLDAGYVTRKTLYNLYHILNHANLFGGGYASQAESMMRKLLAELH
ncbi:MAG: fructosamine kinase family protein [Gammaproteobacteria bacterium]|nr:fructosamine kinase family protein [Gammaproteobacteria bacterium]